MKTTGQAKLVAGLGLVAGILLAIVVPKFWMAALAMVFAFFVVAYNINCVMVGRCVVWGWFLTLLYLCYGIGTICLIFADKKSLVKALKNSM